MNEEDIKILEDKLKLNATTKFDWFGEKEFKAIENLINRNRELEEERQIVGMLVRNKRDGRIGIVLHQWKSGSVAVLESINPRVINTHDSWNTLEIVTDEVKQTQTKCETIPVSLVEGKIEELDRKIKYEDNEKVIIWLHKQKKILQELLEK